MLHIKFENNLPVSVSNKAPIGMGRLSWQCTHNWTSIEQVSAICNQLGDMYIPIDNGPGYSNRFDVILAPKVGDLVSKNFNGDSRPVGTIKSISKTGKKVTTTDGTVFQRKGLSAKWLNRGTFSMIAGHISETNPSF